MTKNCFFELLEFFFNPPPPPKTKKKIAKKRENFFHFSKFSPQSLVTFLWQKNIFCHQKVTKLCSENFKKWKKFSLFLAIFFLLGGGGRISFFLLLKLTFIYFLVHCENLVDILSKCCLVELLFYSEVPLPKDGRFGPKFSDPRAHPIRGDSIS